MQQMLSAKPGLAIVKFWQGSVEIALRVAGIILGLALLITACVTVSQFRHQFDINRGRRVIVLTGIAGSAGWLVFVTLVMLIYEVLVIVARFINFNFMAAFSPIVCSIDICINGILGLFLLIGGIALSALDGFQHRHSYSATVAFSFMLVPVMVALALWMALFVYNKWNNLLVHRTTSKNGQDEASLQSSEETY